MKSLFYIIWLSALVGACSSTDNYPWFGPDSVSFSKNDSARISYSFANTLKVGADTVWLDVLLTGEPKNETRYFSIEILSDGNAKERLHYLPLEAHYELAANAVSSRIPVTVLDIDEQLRDTAFFLHVRLINTETLATGYPELLDKWIFISRRYEKPSIWDDPAGIGGFYGEYSRVKHEICVNEIGLPFPVTLDEYQKKFSFWRAWAAKMTLYFSQNTVYDENGKKIESWTLPF